MVRVPSPWIWQESERMPNIEAFIAALKAASARLADDRRLDRLPVERAEDGARHPVQGALGDRRRRRRRRPPRPKRRFTIPFDFPQFVLGPLSIRAFNTLFYWKHFRRVQRRIVHPESTFYPLDMLCALEPDVRPARAHAAPVRAAERGGRGRRAALPRGADGARRRLVPVRDQGLRPRGRRDAVVPAPRDLDRARHRGARGHAGADRCAERVRDEGGRAHLPGQGRVHARRALSRHGAAHRRVPARAAPLGSGPASCAAPSRCGCSETSRERRSSSWARRRGSGGRWRAGSPRAATRCSCSAATPTISRASARDLEVRGGARRRIDRHRAAAISSGPTISRPRSTPRTRRWAASTRSSSPRGCSRRRTSWRRTPSSRAGC